MSSRFGRYELVRKLGQGGMAEVFLALHRGPGGYEKRLVIKRVLPKLAADARFLRLFFDEAKLHVQLTHGNLVPIFDFGRVGNEYFLALEYVEGTDLEAVIGGAAPLEPTTVAFLGQELCRALAYVHRQNLVHRDVTPRNVLVSIDGEVKLADFGVAQPQDSDGTGVRGTLRYMSPEQARGERVDARSDLYALGIILAEAATGKKVRTLPDENEAALSAISRAERISIEGPFAALVARATEPDPAARYGDAAEMMAALEAIERALGGSRAREVQALAERARALAQPPEESNLVEAAVPAQPATYFRDAATEASIVDAILAPPLAGALPAVPQRSRRGLLLVPLALAGLALAFLVTRERRGDRPAAPAGPAPLATPLALPAPIAVSAPDLGRAEVVERPAPVRTASRPRSVERTVERAAPVGEGSVQVRCFPWCVVEVDGQRRGEDGPTHALALSVGPHRIVARRLDDREERSVQVRHGDRQAIDFRFE